MIKEVNSISGDDFAKIREGWRGWAGGGAIELDLTSSASIEAWIAKYSGSYTRAATMDVDDFEGISRTAPINIPAIYGARQVSNLCLQSQDISTTWITVTGDIIGPDVFQATANWGHVSQSVASITGNSYTYSFTAYLYDTTGTHDVIFRHYYSLSGNNTECTINATPTRYSVTVLGAEDDNSINFGLRDKSDTHPKMVFTDIQIEDVTGQTNQNPSDHIATTTAAVTKYYNTENGNTVSSNVVTEAAGAALTNTIGLAYAPATPHDYHFTNTKLINSSKGSIYIEFEAQPDYATADGLVLLGNGDCEILCQDDVSGISFTDGTNETSGSVGVPSGVIKAVVVWSGTSVSITTANGTTTGTYAENFGNATIYLGMNSTGTHFSGIEPKVDFYYNTALSQSAAEALIA